MFSPLLGFLLVSGSAHGWMPSPSCRRRSHAPKPTPAADKDCEGAARSFWDGLLDRFQGDFDNYRQVVKDRANGLLPREGGGHEQIHCLLVPVPPLVEDETSCCGGRLAAFWFDGIPERIFRFRYYHLSPASSSSGDCVDMQLYCLNPKLEGQLRGMEDPMEWPMAMEQFHRKNIEQEDTVVLLEKCDVQWSQQLDPVQHAYAQERNSQLSQKEEGQPCDDLGIHAVMIHGQAIVDSTMIPGTKILIRDQLSLWKDQFWIHDRGFNPETMSFIYGNQRGVPYQLERVSNIEKDGKRVVAQPDLQWTMGPKWRTKEEYQAKLEVLGGVASSRLNRGGT